MKRAIVALAGVLLLSAGAFGEGWLTSYSDAVKESKRSGRPILMDFTGSDWCTWCQRLHKEVFDTPEFKNWADKNVVLLELDFPNSKPQSEALKKQNQQLAEQYDVQGYPTIIFADAKGKKLGEYGYDKGGPAVWIPKAEKKLKP